MSISRIMEGEIPRRYKDAGSALAKRLAALDEAEASQKARAARQVQAAQEVREAQSVSFAEMLSKAQMAQPAKMPEPVALAPGERAFESLAASESLMARLQHETAMRWFRQAQPPVSRSLPPSK